MYAADEYYLLAERPFPDAAAYDGFPQHENGIGMARAFEAAFHGDVSAAHGVQPGFFSWVDGAPAAGLPGAADRRAAAPPQRTGEPGPGDGIGAPGRHPHRGVRRRGARAAWSRDPAPTVRLVPVPNAFFGGNIAVTGLMTGPTSPASCATSPPGSAISSPTCACPRGGSSTA